MNFQKKLDGLQNSFSKQFVLCQEKLLQLSEEMKASLQVLF